MLRERLIGALLYYLWGFERVVWWEMDSHKENTTSIRTIIWTNDGSLPMEHILSHRTCMMHHKAITIFIQKKKKYSCCDESPFQVSLVPLTCTA